MSTAPIVLDIPRDDTRRRRAAAGHGKPTLTTRGALFPKTAVFTAARAFPPEGRVGSYSAFAVTRNQTIGRRPA